MLESFSIQFEALDNELFINLSGVFDGSSAWQLADLILSRFHGHGKLFIDARGLSSVVPFGADMIVNLAPKSLFGKNKVLIRDRDGIHNGLEHFQSMSENCISEKPPRTFFSRASIF